MPEPDYRPRPNQPTPWRPVDLPRGFWGADMGNQPLREQIFSGMLSARQWQNPWDPLDFHIPANPPWRSWEAETDDLIRRSEDIIRNNPRFPPPHVDEMRQLFPPGIPPAPPGEEWGRRLPQG
jgi:hypothetical protein